MKKTFCILFSYFILMYNCNAQKTTFGISAGATFASYKATIESISVTSKTQVGFSAGLTASVPFSKNFSFRPQLIFVQKGGKQKDDDYTDKLTLNYIQLPLNVVFNANTPNGTFFIGAGPSLNLGISGKDKWHDNMESGGDDIKFGSGDDADFKSFEAGVNVLAGYQFKNGFFISANYNAALNNIAPKDPEFSSKYHNRYFGIQVGIMFSHSHKKESETQ
jgi:hypothetical protein